MGASQTVSLTEFPYYFVKLQLSVYVPIDNVLGGLIAEDFHLDTLAAECKCSGVSLQKVPDEDSLWVPVVIEGPAMRVYDAYRQVEAHVEEVDSVVLCFHLRKSRHMWLSAVAPEVGAETEARIHIPAPEEASDVITIEGSFDAVAFAYERLYDVVKTKGRQFVSRQSLVPRDKVAFVIGTQGHTIQKLQAETCAVVSLQKSSTLDPTAPEAIFNLSGSEDCVDFAAAVIALMCTDVYFSKAMLEGQRSLADVSVFPLLAVVGPPPRTHTEPHTHGGAGGRAGPKRPSLSSADDAGIPTAVAAAVALITDDDETGGAPEVSVSVPVQRELKPWASGDAEGQGGGRGGGGGGRLFLPPKPHGGGGSRGAHTAVKGRGAVWYPTTKAEESDGSPEVTAGPPQAQSNSDGRRGRGRGRGGLGGGGGAV